MRNTLAVVNVKHVMVYAYALRMRDGWQNLKEPHQRLRWARENAGFTSASDAARRMHVNVQTYLTHEEGGNAIFRAGWGYARFFGVSPAWLIAGEGTPEGNPLDRAFSELPEDVKPVAIETIEGLAERYKKKSS